MAVRRVAARPAFALLFALAAAALAAAGAATFASANGSAAGPTIEIRIHYSHYERSSVIVPIGRPVTFVLINEDPIDHEWIVGDAALHERHRTGTEPYHASRPTEVTIPALSTRTTVVTFPNATPLQYICHLPGHEAYGMVGAVTFTTG